MISNFIFDFEEEKKHFSFEQIATIITEFSEYIKSETKKLIREELLKEIYKEKEELHITIRKCREVLETNPEDPVSNTRLGLTYLVKNKTNMAIRQFKKSLKTLPSYKEALFYLGFSYYLQDKPELAREYIHKIEDELDIIKLCVIGDIYNTLEEVDLAIECFERALEINEDFHVIHINLGSIYTLEGNLEKAIELYKNALQKNPENLIISINLAFNLYLIGELSQSLNITKAILDSKELPVTLFSYGFFLFQDDRFDEAIEYYKKAIELEPCHFFYNTLGFLYFSRNDTDKAIDNYLKSLKYNHDYGPARINLGFAYEISGELDSAIQEYNIVAPSEPDNGMLYYNMATVLRLKGELDEAHEYYTKATLIDSELALAYAGLGLTYLDKWIKSQKNDKNLLMLCQENIHMALNIDPRMSIARLALGTLYLERDNPVEALRHFEALSRIVPDSFPTKVKIYETYLSLADKASEQNKLDMAKQYCEKALQIEAGQEDKDDRPLLMADIKLEGAKEKFVSFSEQLGDFYYKKGMTNKAQEQYKRIVEIDWKTPAIHVKLGKIYFVKKETDLAEKHYKIALRLDTSLDSAYFNLGLLYQNKGDDLQALECFQNYLKISPQGQYAREAEKNIKELYPQMDSTAEEDDIEEISKEDNIARWNIIASHKYKENDRRTDDIYYGPECAGEKKLRLLGEVSGKKVLDLGCGSGGNSIALALRGAEVKGLDFSEEQIGYGRELAQKTLAKADFIKADIEELEFLKGQDFDIVLSCRTLSYIENIFKVFMGVKKVIKRGGIFVFSIFHPLGMNVSNENFVRFQGNNYPFIKNYFHTGKEEVSWKTDGGDIKLFIYKRKLEDIINPLLTSGFRPVRLFEPPSFYRDKKENLSSFKKNDSAELIPQTLIIKTMAG